MKFFFIALIIMSLNSNCLGQFNEEALINPRADRSTGFYGAIVSAGVYSISIRHFVSPSFSIELGTGNRNFGGFRIHLNGKNPDKNWTTNVGLYVNSSWAYFPIGFHYLGNSGFALGLDLSIVVAGGGPVPYGAFRVGYHF